jgi:hypothetical protein
MAETDDTDPVSLHEDWLVARAREIAREQPEVRPVALVMEKDAPETMSILLSKAEINRADDKSISVIITRESAKGLLLKWTPGMLEWLDDNRPGSLPVILFARRGLRTRTIEYDAAY